MESKQSQVLNLERVKALETWLQTTNTKLSQVNGQRKYGGPPEGWEGPAPGGRCEVFISQIPRDAYEDLLIPLFNSVGPLWEFRLMMNFSGQNRGFAYAKYGSADLATDAIRLLQGHMLEPGFRLSVRRSIEKRHLCMEDLPATTKQEDLLQVLRVLTGGVERVSLKAGPGIEGMSAIIAFSSHHSASMAKKVLVEAFKKEFALTISIKWQSAVKPGLNEPPQKPSTSLLPFPPNPPRHALSFPRPSLLPPRLARPPSIPPGFCKAVGGRTTPQSQPPPPTSSPPQGHPPPPTSSPPQGHPVSAGSPKVFLGMMCEATGVGQPLYEMQYSHTGLDGYLCFTYKVCIPGLTMAFNGMVMLLPGPSASTVLEEAQRAAAQQVIQRIYNNQLAY